MSFCNIFCNARYSYGGSSRHDFETRLAGHCTPNSQVAVHEMHDQHLVVQASCWDSFPPELLNDVITRLDSESTWPFCKNVVACAGVCRSWREICKEIVKNPEFSGKFTFPVSLKQVAYYSLYYSLKIDFFCLYSKILVFSLLLLCYVINYTVSRDDNA